MRGFLHDLKIALRTLAAARWTAAAAILTLALGTGVNTSVFAVAYGILLRPLPYQSPAHIVVLSVESRGSEFAVPLETFDQWRQRVRTLERMAAYSHAEFTLRGLGELRVVRAAIVKGDFFEVLGVQPMRGQAVGRGDSDGWVAVSSRATRELTSGASEAALGRSVTLGQGSYVVSAVMPPAFAFPSEQVVAWVPTSSTTAIQGFSERQDVRSFRVIARMKPGVKVAQVRDDVDRVLRETNGPGYLGRARVQPLEDVLTGRVRPVLGALVAAAILVLLVACGNVATLLVSRTLAHRHDLAVRLALGASRLQLVRGVLAESLLLAVAASAAGVWIGLACIQVFVRLAAGVLPRLDDVAVDLPVLALSAAVALIITLLCGAAPALHAVRTDFASAFRETAATTSRGARRLRSALVAGQIALALVLLTGAGLVTRTVTRLLDERTGIDAKGVLSARLVMSDTTTFSAGSRAPFVEQVIARVSAIPGVQVAGIGSNLPPSVAALHMSIRVVTEGSQRRDESQMIALASATPGFFKALGVRLVRGRLFDDSEIARGTPVAVLSESSARHLSPDRDIVGRQLPFTPPPAPRDAPRPQVVGVVSDIKYGGLDAAAVGAIYVPWASLPAGVSYLVVRTARDPVALVPGIRQAVRDIDPTMPVPDVRVLEDEILNSIADRRLRLVPAISFAVLALAVALVGLSGSVARAAAERRRELAIRGALGASPRRNLRMVLREGAVVTAIGVVLGLAGSAGVGRLLASLLYGVSPYDPLTFATAAAIVAVGALGACYVSARRALSVDLLELLRAE